MKIFVFGIGGTGSRVLRSLTYLLAAGVDLKPDTEIIPIIVDMDTNNGDTARTKSLINNYRKIREASYPGNNPKEGFFYPNLKSLASYNTTNFNGHIQDSFQLDFGNIDDTFYRYMKVESLDSINNKFLESLFDNSQPSAEGSKNASSTELHLKLSLGFKGNPNIGSIIFNELIHTDEYRYFEDICTENDKVFIVSSIFGGTGSSGFPQLVKNIRDSDKTTVKNVHIGALVVMPYFLIGRDRESVIDANNFNSKTKAALSYYSTELDGLVNDTYYIGCQDTGDAYENHEGGVNQINRAHIVELLGASSIVNFINLKHKETGATDYHKFGNNYYEYGMKKDRRNFDFRHFFGNEHRNLRALTCLTYFAKFMKEDILSRKSLGAAYAKNLDITAEKFENDDYYNLLMKFLVNNYYSEWLEELSNNTPSFSPFNFSEGYKRFIKNKDVRRLDADYFIKNLTIYENKHDSITATQEIFMKGAYEACKNAFDLKLGKFPVG